MNSVRIRRTINVLAVAVLVVGIFPAAAFAGHQLANVDQYTGCLKTSGQGNGNIYALTVGDTPLVSCKGGEVTVHVSGGDITAVIAGDGLTGGSENGSATLSLGESFQLPQTCTDGQIPEWANGSWACTDDDNTTYTAGTGLDLSAANVFSVEPEYRLPQGCTSGQPAEFNGTAWSCGSDDTGVGGIAATLGTIGITTLSAGPCDDGPGGNFIPNDSNQFDAGPVTLDAGTYRPYARADMRWFISKTAELDDGESFYSGDVQAEIIEVATGDVVSHWARTAANNGDGTGLPYDSDFGSFTTSGGDFILRVIASTSGCTKAEIHDAAVDLDRVG